MGWYGEWRPYVPVAQRRAQAARFAKKLAKKEKRSLAPVNITGRKIATTFWGQAWLENLERYSDFENRLPRGRTYVRNGSVIDLVIERGRVKAIVSGSDIYQVQVSIAPLSQKTWKQIRDDCANSIDSLIDLLSGKLDQGVMQRLTRSKDGLFPQPKEIGMKCSCPDWAIVCKHVAAVMYGVGARLDSQPELLFTLRDVDQTDLIQQATAGGNLDRLLTASGGDALGQTDLGELFGIDLESGPASSPDPIPERPRARRAAPARRTKKPVQPMREALARRKPLVKQAAAALSPSKSAETVAAAKPKPRNGRKASVGSSPAKSRAKTISPRGAAASRATKPRRKKQVG